MWPLFRTLGVERQTTTESGIYENADIFSSLPGKQAVLFHLLFSWDFPFLMIIFSRTDLTENSWGLSPIEEEEEEEPYWCQTDEYLCQEYHHQRHLQIVDFNPKLHSSGSSDNDAAVEVTAAEAARRSYETLEAEGSTEDVYYPCEDTPPQYNNKV
jgi:hypothetical protein